MKILIAYDQNTAVSNVLDRGVSRARETKGSVYLVRTCSQGLKEEEIADIEKRLDELKKDVFDSVSIPCETHLLIRGVNPGEDIVRYAKQQKVDEIVIGIKKRSKLGKLVFGSNAQNIILEAHCPVLCVK